ncbi:3-isopropylmalate dehydratase small subunit [Shouchella lehensis]|uniref:3-isopropylmalate dehydratase small subunit n=2 Tax=Shouchella lehensis TaxID=300825 RepID=A0A060LVB1_9BACI|nr:3-isopropylmalate dehydratase small subunit [Shouchella lehensis]AIC95196.1 isopropylmalate isomerase small subunit [Shouchella lehensis G1]MBG9783990.1 isopropylmalate isomerase [Shouchella lehensis]RQW21013.1 3-isopropylmalate dehydratase small subunit [Bacillus sp. C1-1]TES51037.1 3-isopropylmalate dehydratase small subunit [Shouchella lehensis]
MNPIRIHRGKAAVLDRVNVDTDQIIPKQFLKRIERTGFGQFLFYDWRYEAEGKENPDFELNHPSAKGASILISGDNFGCGSSREHAPWALYDYGFKVVIASSFADIFYNNCVKNGLLPIRLSDEEVKTWMTLVNEGKSHITVDLLEQKVIGDRIESSFEIDPHWKKMLINGWDEIDLTLKLEEHITNFEASYTSQ